MKLKVKKTIKHAKLPTYAHVDDGGMDLYAADNGYFNTDYQFVEYDTGIAVEIPKDYVGLIFPRSSISKTPHMLCNSVGVIDCGYTGSVKLRFKTDQEKEYLEYKFGDRIAQLILVHRPKLELEEVSELRETERGDGGFGHTDKVNSVDEFLAEVQFSEEEDV